MLGEETLLLLGASLFRLLFMVETTSLRPHRIDTSVNISTRTGAIEDMGRFLWYVPQCFSHHAFQSLSLQMCANG